MVAVAITDPSSKWMDVYGLMAYLGLTEHFVRRKAAAGLIPAHRAGLKFLRFHKDEIDQWIRDGGLERAQQIADRQGVEPVTAAVRVRPSRAGRSVAASAPRGDAARDDR